MAVEPFVTESGGSPGGVGETALGAAMMRAAESVRPDRLFEDRYAENFLAAAPDAFADGPVDDSPEFAAMVAAFQADMVVRTKFYDDYLMGACADGCRQVVLVAAGLDTRAFRLDWPADVQLYELDLPEVLAFKERVLAAQHAQPRCARIAVAADLREEWPARLTDAGFDTRESTAWLIEGLLPYLSNTDAARLLEAVTDLSRSGSRMSFEDELTDDDTPLSQARGLTKMDGIADMWEGGLREPALDWLARHGWRGEFRARVALGHTYGRAVPDGFGGGYVLAERVDT